MMILPCYPFVEKPLYCLSPRTLFIFWNRALAPHEVCAGAILSCFLNILVSGLTQQDVSFQQLDQRYENYDL